MESRAYRLSRIYSQGWKAAKEMLLDFPESPYTKPTAPENPHGSLEERARWKKGFEDALCSGTDAHGGSNVRPWRPSHRRISWTPSRDIKR